MTQNRGTASGGRDVPHRLECIICEEDFKEPKILPCFHTFCLVCLDIYVKNNAENSTFKCPLCRNPIDIPEGGLTEFQNNFYIPNSSKTRKICDICSNPAISVCTDCDEYYCSTCLRAHTTMKVSKHHRFQDLIFTKDEETIKFRKTTYCQYHTKEEVKFICKDCNGMICIICLLTEHAEHRSAGLAAEAEEKRQQMSTLIEQLSNNQERMDRHLQTLVSFEIIHEKIVGRQKTELSKFVEKAVEAIREKERGLQHDLAKRKKESLRNMKATRKIIKIKDHATETLVASLESAFEKCSDADLLTIFEQGAGHVDSELNSNKDAVYLLEESSSFDIGWIGKITQRHICLDDGKPVEPTQPFSTLSAVDYSEDDIDGSHETTTPNVSVRQQSFVSTLHDLISTRRAPNDEVIDWIMNNVDDAVQNDGLFIREITNTVLSNAFEVSATGTYNLFNGQTFVNRKELLQKVCRKNPELEFHLLYQIQLMVTSLDNPPGRLLQEIYWLLCEQEIVCREGFLHLESSGNLMTFSSTAKEVLIQIINQIRVGGEDD